MTYDFSGQCVAITGGASGMGLAAAQAFARAGASVLIGDIADEAGETAAARIRGLDSIAFISILMSRLRLILRVLSIRQERTPAGWMFLSRPQGFLASARCCMNRP